MQLAFFLSLCTLFLTVQASAGTVIMNTSIGRDCYIATLQDPSPDNDRKGLATCNEAVAVTRDDKYNHVAAIVNRSDIRLRMMDFQAAVADAEQAIALDPNEPVAHLNRGAGMIGLKRYSDSISSLEKAISLDVKPLHLAYFDRALAREALHDIAGAYRDYKKALELNPGFQLAAQELVRFRVN
jgi:tetratricopeptide (TPR) repeat protein